MQISGATTAPMAMRSQVNPAAAMNATKDLTKMAVATDASKSGSAADAVSMVARGQVDPMNPEAIASMQAAMGLV